LFISSTNVSKSSVSFSTLFAYISFAFSAFFITPSSPTAMFILIVAKMIKTTIVTTNAINVIPFVHFSYFFSIIFSFHLLPLFHFFFCKYYLQKI